jgi:hypothetical protein
MQEEAVHIWVGTRDSFLNHATQQVNRMLHLWRNTHKVMNGQFETGMNGWLEMYFQAKEYHVDPRESDIFMRPLHSLYSGHMNRLCPLEHWYRGFEFYSRHGCVCVCLFRLSVFLCVGCGYATGWSPSKESYRLCSGIRNCKSVQDPTKDCTLTGRQIARCMDR